jgi:hypothetical protein
MSLNCPTQAGYPYADDAACKSACAAFSAEEYACWSKYCGWVPLASSEEDETHLCQHAWGMFGLDEC